MNETERLAAVDKMIVEAFALQKRGLMRDADGNVVKIQKAEKDPMETLFDKEDIEKRGAESDEDEMSPEDRKARGAAPLCPAP